MEKGVGRCACMQSARSSVRVQVSPLMHLENVRRSHNLDRLHLIRPEDEGVVLEDDWPLAHRQGEAWRRHVLERFCERGALAELTGMATTNYGI